MIGVAPSIVAKLVDRDKRVSMATNHMDPLKNSDWLAIFADLDRTMYPAVDDQHQIDAGISEDEFASLGLNFVTSLSVFVNDPDDPNSTAIRDSSNRVTLTLDELVNVITFLAKIHYQWNDDDDDRRLSNQCIRFGMFFIEDIGALEKVMVLDPVNSSNARKNLQRILDDSLVEESAAKSRQDYLHAKIAFATAIRRVGSVTLNTQITHRKYLIDPTDAKSPIASVIIPTYEEGDIGHFYFTVLDSHLPWMSESPEIIVFDSFSNPEKNKKSAEMDFELAKILDVAPMNLPVRFRSNDMHQKDGWRCGYFSYKRAISVARWLERNRVYDPERGMFNSMSSLPVDTSEIFNLTVDEEVCHATVERLIKVALVYYRYLRSAAVIFRTMLEKSSSFSSLEDA